MKDVWIFEDGELAALLSELPRDGKGVYRVRVSTSDDGFKIKINEGIWSPPMGKREER